MQLKCVGYLTTKAYSFIYSLPFSPQGTAIKLFILKKKHSFECVSFEIPIAPSLFNCFPSWPSPFSETVRPPGDVGVLCYVRCLSFVSSIARHNICCSIRRPSGEEEKMIGKPNRRRPIGGGEAKWVSDRTDQSVGADDAEKAKKKKKRRDKFTHTQNKTNSSSSSAESSDRCEEEEVFFIGCEPFGNTGGKFGVLFLEME